MYRLILMLVIACILSGCATENFGQSVKLADKDNAIVVTDDTGHQVKLKKKPEKIMTNNIYLDNILLGLVEPEKMLSVSKNMDNSAKSFGNMVSSLVENKITNPGLEAVLALKPDIFIVNEVKDTLVLGMTISKEEAEDRSKHMQGDRKNYGLYASYKYAFSDKFDVTAGIRGQHISEDYMKGQNKTKSHNEFVPQIQALYKLSDNISWYANAAKSYQLPPLNQFFSYPGRRVDDLKPQEGWTYETGIKHITDTASVKAGVYHMDIDAKFDWVDIGLPDKVLKNVGKFKNDGLEIEYKKHLSDQLSYNLGAAFSNPKTKEEGKNFYKQSDAKLQLTAGIDYTVGKLSSNLNFLYLGKRESSYYNSLGSKGSDHSIPHRSLLNANFTYKADEHHSASLTLNNLLDRDDTINKYENWGMPFNWMLTYNYTF